MAELTTLSFENGRAIADRLRQIATEIDDDGYGDVKTVVISMQTSEDFYVHVLGDSNPIKAIGIMTVASTIVQEATLSHA